MNTEDLNCIIERRILHGLSCEWETALWVLPEPHAIAMKKPLFSIGNSNTRLAFWKEETREICFSRSFVLNHPWDSVKEVLLHEIAHQMVSEVFKTRNETSHGPTFVKACDLLRANPKASGTYQSLSQRIGDDLGTNDKIMVKVRKLLALAESSNINEAESALAKAHRLIEKYNIDLLANNREREFISVFAGKPALRHFKEEYLLAKLLTDHYFVYGIWISSYVMDKEKMGRVLELTGTRQNIQIACYVYDYIRQYINTSWANYNADKGLNRYRKSDFAAGIIEGFNSKLIHERKRTQLSFTESTKCLPVHMEDPKLTEYTGYKYPSVKNVQKRVSGRDETVISDGKELGKQLIISKGIEHHSSDKGLQLT